MGIYDPELYGDLDNSNIDYRFATHYSQYVLMRDGTIGKIEAGYYEDIVSGIPDYDDFEIIYEVKDIILSSDNREELIKYWKENKEDYL